MRTGHRLEAPARLALLALRSTLLYACAASLGLALLVTLFKLGVAGSVDILFYRGLILCGLASTITVVLVALAGRRLARISLSEAIAAGALSLGLNLSFLVIAPVTVDRSISVFLLGHMAQHGQRIFTTPEMEDAFRRVYLGEFDQIQRRMAEQERSGNIVRKEDGYVLSLQGAAFVRWAHMIAWAFDTDPRILQSGSASPRTSDGTRASSAPR